MNYIKIDCELIKIINICTNYTKYINDYYFKCDISVNENLCDAHICIYCEKLSHQLDINIYKNNDNIIRMYESEYIIEFRHNDDICLYEVTDMRVDIIPQLINYELKLIIEMNS